MLGNRTEKMFFAKTVSAPLRCSTRASALRTLGRNFLFVQSSSHAALETVQQPLCQRSHCLHLSLALALAFGLGSVLLVWTLESARQVPEDALAFGL